MGVYGGRWDGAERKKKVTADGNKKDPKEKGKVADVRTKARPSSRCLGPATKYFGRDLIFKGAAPDKSRVEAIAQTDESHQRIADDLCRRRATHRNKSQQYRIRREPRPALVLKLANRQRGYRKVVVMNHGRPMTSDRAVGRPFPKSVLSALSEERRLFQAARLHHPVCFPLQTLETSPLHIADHPRSRPQYRHMTVLPTQITFFTTRVSGLHPRDTTPLSGLYPAEFETLLASNHGRIPIENLSGKKDKLSMN